MKPLRRSPPWLSLVLALLVVACQPLPPTGTGPRTGPGPGPGRASIGRLHVDAAGVRLNDRPVAGDATLFIGDDVRTDATGRATIFFDAGGKLVLSPNTDPLFQLVSEAGCVGVAVLQVIIKAGTFDFFNLTRVCLCDPQDMICMAPSSDFRVVITSNGATITVSQGALRVTVGRPPGQRRYNVVQGQTMFVQKGTTQGPQPTVHRPTPQLTPQPGGGQIR